LASPTSLRDSSGWIPLRRALQPVLVLLGLGVVVWSVVDARFRDTQGFLTPQVGLAFSIGLALMVLGAALFTRWKKFAFWFTLTLIGQAVALQLIDAGPLLHYQHYKPLDRLLSDSPLLLLFLGVQSVFVIVGLGSHWQAIGGWLNRRWQLWQLLVLALIFVIPAAAFSRDVSFYLVELVFAVLVQVLNLGNVILLVWAIPAESLIGVQQKIEMVLGTANDETTEPGGLDRFAICAALWVMLLTAALAYFIYDRIPHIPDEVIYLFHARYFANGLLTIPAPPVPQAFSIYLIPFAAAQWYSPFPPGWPAVLALGVKLGVSWLVNPILAGLAVALTYLLCRELYSRYTARLAVLLLCVSPWFIFMGMNWMSHTLTLSLALLAMVAMARARRTGKFWWALLSGGTVGAVSLVRPLDGLAVGIVLGPWAILGSERQSQFRNLIGFGLGALLIGGLILPYNDALTGNPVTIPLEAYYETYFGHNSNALGFGPERGLGWQIDAFPGHSPFEAVLNSILNLFSVNIELFGWSIGSLVLVTLFLVSGTLRKNIMPLIALIVVVIALYGLYWFNGGPDFGARYWYLILVPLVVLTVKGIQFLQSSLAASSTNSLAATRVIVAVLALCLMSLVNFFPWRALDKYHHYLNMLPDMAALAHEYNFQNSLVLIRGESHPDYAAAWIYNPLDYRDDGTIYAWDRDAELRRQILNAFPARTIWFVDGPTITHSGYRVGAGPLSAREALTR